MLRQQAKIAAEVVHGDGDGLVDLRGGDDGPGGFAGLVAVLVAGDFADGEVDGLCAAGADALVILTEWNQFRSLDFARLRGLLEEPLLIDLRNIYEPEKVASAGFRYVSIGRREGTPAATGVEA